MLNLINKYRCFYCNKRLRYNGDYMDVGRWYQRFGCLCGSVDVECDSGNDIITFIYINGDGFSIEYNKNSKSVLNFYESSSTVNINIKPEALLSFNNKEMQPFVKKYQNSLILL